MKEKELDIFEQQEKNLGASESFDCNTCIYLVTLIYLLFILG